jgi:hypothetical protein
LTVSQQRLQVLGVVFSLSAHIVLCLIRYWYVGGASSAFTLVAAIAYTYC